MPAEQLSQIVADQKETPFVHIMGWATQSEYLEENEPEHIDSLPEQEWLELEQSVREFALSVAGAKIHAPFVERDVKRYELKLEKNAGGWQIKGYGYESKQFTSQLNAKIALSTIIGPALQAFEQASARHCKADLADAVAVAYAQREIVTPDDLLEVIALFDHHQSQNEVAA